MWPSPLGMEQNRSEAEDEGILGMRPDQRWRRPIKMEEAEPVGSRAIQGGATEPVMERGETEPEPELSQGIAAEPVGDEAKPSRS